uniref:Uncharacterized protein n=1 Tax=Anopheles melas TaxID=34690 RepID=A0A182U6P4_9DIPT
MHCSFDQSEIPRTYVKAPPNKTVRDVPLQYQSTGGITTHGTTTATMTGTGGSSSLASSMVDVASYYGSAKTIAGRPAGDGGRLAAATPGPSLGGGATNSSSSATCQQKSVDKLQKIFRFLPVAATSPTSSSVSSSSTASSPTSLSSARPSEATGPGAEPGHAPFTM